MDFSFKNIISKYNEDLDVDTKSIVVVVADLAMSAPVASQMWRVQSSKAEHI